MEATDSTGRSSGNQEGESSKPPQGGFVVSGTSPASKRSAPVEILASRLHALPAWQVLGVYLLLNATVSFLFFSSPGIQRGLLPWSPAAGLSLSLLLLLGLRWLPAVFVSAVVTKWILFGYAGGAGYLIGPLLLTLTTAAIAVFLRRRQPVVRFDSLISALRLGLAITAGSVLLTLMMLLVSTQAATLEGVNSPMQTLQMGFAVLSGMLTVTPAVLMFEQWREAVRIARRHWPEVAAQTALVAVILLVVFGLIADHTQRSYYPLFLPMTWVVTRWGAGGAAAISLFIQLALQAAIALSDTPAAGNRLESLMPILSGAALLLGAAISERRAISAEIETRAEQQRRMYMAAPDAIVTVDHAGCITQLNAMAQQLFGGAATAGMPLAALLPDLRLEQPIGRALIEFAGAGGRPLCAEVSWNRTLVGSDLTQLLIFRDVTEQQRISQRDRVNRAAVSRAMRAALAGELSSALAHELKQPITALVSYLHAADILAAPLADRDPRLPDTLAKARQEALRASDVLQRLRNFFLAGEVRREPVDVLAVCMSAIDNLKSRFASEQVSFRNELPDALPRFVGDGPQLEIVIYNLLANSIDACGERPPRQRQVRLRAAWRETELQLYVEDSGGGVDSETEGMLFEAFNTSKPSGMGLGLALSRSLLRAQGARLVYERSAVLGGASFCVRLPLGQDPLADL